MARNRHLQQRGGVWHYSRTVPPDVRPVLGVGRYWRFSLHTPHKSEAASLRDEWDVRYNRQIEEVRKLTGAQKLSRIRTARSSRLPKAYEDFFKDKAFEPKWDVLANATHVYVSGQPEFTPFNNTGLAEANDLLVKTEAGLLSIAPESLNDLTEDERKEIEEAGGVESFYRDTQRLRIKLAALKETQLNTRDKIAYEVETRYLLSKLAILAKLGLVDAADNDMPESDDNPRILTALESWLKKRKMSPSTKKKYRMHINRLANFHGNLTLKTFTPQMVEIFVTAYGDMPNTRRLSPRERGLSMRELLAKRKLNPDLPPYGAVNVIKMCDYLKSFLRAMKRKDLADAIVKPEDDRSLSKQREGFPPISPAYMRLLLPAVDKRWGAKSDTAWWIWLLVYSGMRPEEAAQLARKNVVKQGELWCIEVDDEEDRRVKNAASLRTVPIHPKLIERGFIKFAKPGQPGNVFASFKDDKGDLSDNPSRRLKALLIKLGIEGYGSAHRFRASYIDAMRNARVSYAVELRLVGHTDKNRVHGGYGVGADVRTAARELHKIDPCKDP